ncbi:short repeat uncharacterized protein DUF308 [Pseudonocardia hierapolitana]|uniref:Short repeat uncharacterized protein DUF308 n=1 Tax=Pseudonocardia hierapolitana TaxID=1128676 RepID=A0A561SI95_9PSEU|nr:DUF308 domain-containing protein [Pseudonocardia hierapolitana]TWF74577.1 short repeat uncharacterized protein DUF308 [Pseudonocardia hierapolitana]
MPTLLRIYLVRGIVAIAWAAGFAAVSGSLTAVTVALLIIYPLIDVVASLLDAREDPGPARTLQIFNTTLSALAAVALGVAALRGIGAVLFAFGVWAIVSGIAQFTVAIRRRTALGRQWPMLIAGALSVIAGASYLPAALGEAPRLDMLVVYTAAGGVFFVLQALTLAWRQRRQTVNV